jgi:hypothetical protein
VIGLVGVIINGAHRALMCMPLHPKTGAVGACVVACQLSVPTHNHLVSIVWVEHRIL